MRARDLLYLAYHKKVGRWTIGPSYVPHGFFEAEEDAQGVLDKLLKIEARAERIRACTREENQDERARHQSGCVGVTWNCRVHDWQACITVDGIAKVKHFKHLSDAVHHRRKLEAAKKQHDIRVRAAYKKRVAKDKAATRAWKEKKREKKRLNAHLYRDILRDRKKY